MADAKPAVERLSEDESLRGDLSDIGFGPLLDWAVAAVEAYAPKAADADALDVYTSRVRGVVQAAVQAAQDSKLDDPATLLDFEPADKEKTLAALKAVTFSDDPDENGSQLAAALQTGLSSTNSVSPEAASPASPETTTPLPTPTQEAAPPVPVTQEAQPQPQTQVTPTQEAASSSETAPTAPAAVEPVKKNEQAGVSASPPNPNPEPPANPVPTNPRPGGLLGDLRSRMGQAYNSAWGVFKGLSRRRSG
ncbi:MAG: hypothetical protein J0I20_01260 [Chloroflexi bacterium]|nr:hypothetical protein [Chloroflexota bacterium]OJV89582.1 MAG: hypothetical protein BGO39_37120 [Chloroflexi bacterium 54-19]